MCKTQRNGAVAAAAVTNDTFYWLIHYNLNVKRGERTVHAAAPKIWNESKQQTTQQKLLIVAWISRISRCRIQLYRTFLPNCEFGTPKLTRRTCVCSLNKQKVRFGCCCADTAIFNGLCQFLIFFLCRKNSVVSNMDVVIYAFFFRLLFICLVLLCSCQVFPRTGKWLGMRKYRIICVYNRITAKCAFVRWTH